MTRSAQPEVGFVEVNGTQLYYETLGQGHPPKTGDVTSVNRAKVTSVMLTATLALFFDSPWHHGQDGATRNKIVVSSFCLLGNKDDASSAGSGRP